MNLRGYWPVAMWAILIFILHIIPSDKIPNPPDWGFSVDKLVHFILFAGLSYLLLRQKYLKKREWKASDILLISIVATLFGIIMEFIQIAVRGREFNLIDLTADGLGALSGCFGYVGIIKLIKS